MDHIQFIPELPNQSDPINRLGQSRKWREELDRDLRVQMVDLPNGHFYVFEPVQLQSKQIVVPMFLYKVNQEVFAKCVFTNQIYQRNTSDGRPQVHLEFRSVSDFNSEDLASINVKLFWRTFEKIEL